MPSIQRTFLIRGGAFWEGRIAPPIVLYGITTIVGANWSLLSIKVKQENEYTKFIIYKMGFV